MSDMLDILFERLDENLVAYFAALQGADGLNLKSIYEASAMVDTHNYFKTKHSYVAGEAEALLDFRNPLEVIHAGSHEYISNYDEFSIIDVLDNINAYARYEVVEQAMGSDELNRRKLMIRLDTNIAEYRMKLARMTPGEVMESVNDVAATCNAYGYLKEIFELEPAEVKYLLRFQNPLEVVKEHWSTHSHELFDQDLVMEGVMGDQERDLKRFALDQADTGHSEPDSKAPEQEVDSPRIELESGRMYIFQVKEDEEYNHLRDQGYSYYENVGWECDAADYDLVHVETLGSEREPEEHFEKAAVIFDGKPPEDFSGRPMERGDIVVVTPHGEAHAFYNEGAGFYQKVDYFLSQIATNVEFPDPESCRLKPREELQAGTKLPLPGESITQWLKDQANRPGQPAPNSIPKHTRDDDVL